MFVDKFNIIKFITFDVERDKYILIWNYTKLKNIIMLIRKRKNIPSNNILTFLVETFKRVSRRHILFCRWKITKTTKISIIMFNMKNRIKINHNNIMQIDNQWPCWRWIWFRVSSNLSILWSFCSILLSSLSKRMLTFLMLSFMSCIPAQIWVNISVWLGIAGWG